MLASILFSVLMIHTVDVGVSFGPGLPIGRLENTYKTTASLSIFTDINRLELNYSYIKFNDRISSNENLSLHSGIVSYQYPFYSTDKRKISGQIGTGYHRVIRTLNTNSEKGYGLGIRYGVKYEQKLTDAKYEPTLIFSIITDQIIQTRNWNSMQTSSSAYLLKAMIGLKINLL